MGKKGAVLADFKTSCLRIGDIVEIGNRAPVNFKSMTYWADLAVLGMAAFFSVFFATVQGIGLLPVSAAFLQAAQNLQMGHGFSISSDGLGFQPFTQEPPLYALILLLFGGRLENMAFGLRLFQALLFAASTMMVGWVGRQWTGSRFLGVVSGLLFLCNKDLSYVFALLQADGLFLFLCILSLALFPMAWGAQRKRFFILHMLVLSLALFTRWEAVALWAGFGLAIFAVENPSPRAWWEKAVWLLTPILGVVGWYFKVRGFSDVLSFTYNPLGPRDIYGLASTLLDWLLPSSLPGVLRGVLFFGFCFWLVLGFYGAVKRGLNVRKILGILRQSQILAWVFFSMASFLFVFLGHLFVDATLPFDSRSLVPIYPGLVLLFVLYVGKLFRKVADEGLFLNATVIFGVLMAGLFIWNLKISLRRIHLQGIGYSSVAWKSSPFLGYLATHSFSGLTYSNAPDLLFLKTAQRAEFLPAKLNSKNQSEILSFDDDVHAMQKKLREAGGRIVFFHQIYWRRYLVHLEDLTEKYGFHVTVSYPDGVILE